SPRGGVRRVGTTRRHALVLRRVGPDEVRDRHGELRRVLRPSRCRAGRESLHRRARQDCRGVRARGDQGVRRRMPDDVYTLPPNMPVPQDDGGAAPLLGAMLPQLTLESSQGDVSLRELASERLVLYIYPRAGRPGRPAPAGWDDIPGARGCTPESCAFRDHAAELAAVGPRPGGLPGPTPR